MKMWKVNSGTYIREQVLKNLLCAHKRIADKGNVSALINLSKFILKLSKKFDNGIFNFGEEDSNDSAKNPPDKCEKNIP